MRVGINLAILSSRWTGIGHYALSLVQALARVSPADEWILFGVDGSARSSFPTKPNFQLVNQATLSGWRRVAWEQFELPRLARKYGVDVLHCPDFSRPLRCHAPVVNTLHDLSYYGSQAYFPPAKRAYKRFLTNIAVHRSANLIAVSEFTRQEVLGRFGIPEEKITVIHHGVEQRVCQAPAMPADPFILYVGTLEARKNIATLIRAFGLLRANRSIPHRLVLIGQKGWGWAKIRRVLDDCPARDHVELPGYVSREKLLQLYAEAALFVYPSYYEGFGMPILEAMAAGLPVVSSQAPALREAGGDAAVYFDPGSVEDLEGAIRRLVDSPEMLGQMRQKGLDRAAQLTWDKCAKRHVEVYTMAARTRCE